MAPGRTRMPRRALLHALLEATERDQLARALPEGWTEEGVWGGCCGRRCWSEGRRARRRCVTRCGSEGFGVYLFDATPTPRTPGAVGLPVAAAVLVDEERRAGAAHGGLCVRAGRDEALLKALLEAAQSRLTDIHGAREDVAAADRERARGSRGLCLSAPRAARCRRGDAREDSGGQCARCCRGGGAGFTRWRRAGFTPVAAVTLDRAGHALWSSREARWWCQGMRISEPRMKLA